MLEEHSIYSSLNKRNVLQDWSYLYGCFFAPTLNQCYTLNAEESLRKSSVSAASSDVSLWLTLTSWPPWMERVKRRWRDFHSVLCSVALHVRPCYLCSMWTWIYPQTVSQYISVLKLFPVHSEGSWIQGLLPGLPRDESRRPAFDVAGQRRQRAEGNATVDTAVSYLRPGQAYVIADVTLWSLNYSGTSFPFLIDVHTLRASLPCPAEGLHPKPNPGDSDGAAAFRVGLRLRCRRSRCLLPFRGTRDQPQVWVLQHFCPVLYFGHNSKKIAYV